MGSGSELKRSCYIRWQTALRFLSYRSSRQIPLFCAKIYDQIVCCLRLLL